MERDVEEVRAEAPRRVGAGGIDEEVEHDALAAHAAGGERRWGAVRVDGVRRELAKRSAAPSGTRAEARGRLGWGGGAGWGSEGTGRGSGGGAEEVAPRARGEDAPARRIGAARRTARGTAPRSTPR